MNIDLKDIPAKFQTLFRWLRQYMVFICMLVVLSIFVFLVWQIHHFATVEPSSSDVVNKVNELHSPKLDQNAVNKILLLEDQNVEVKALFNSARQNPFQE